VVWQEFPPVISRCAISFLLNHDPYLLIIRSDVIIFCLLLYGVNDKSLGNRTRGHFDSKSSEAESESSLQSARTARCVLVSRDRNAPAAAHCVKKIFRSATDTVGLSVPQAQGIHSTAKEVSAIKRAPREVCRTGHCAQPNIYPLATAVDPTTAAGGTAAAAAGAGGPGAAGAAAAAGKKK
jgi:hypothetical protein